MTTGSPSAESLTSNSIMSARSARESEKELYRIAKLVTQSSADLLNEWFEFDPLKGTKSASGVIGTFLGPYS